MRIIFIDENGTQKDVKCDDLDTKHQISVEQYLRRNPKTEIITIDEEKNINCENCTDCSWCTDCDNCKNCKSCDKCKNCTSCISCRDCNYCQHYYENNDISL